MPDPTARTMQLLVAAALAEPGTDRKLMLAELCALPTGDVVMAATGLLSQYADEAALRRIILGLALLAA